MRKTYLKSIEIFQVYITDFGFSINILLMKIDNWNHLVEGSQKNINYNLIYCKISANTLRNNWDLQFITKVLSKLEEYATGQVEVTTPPINVFIFVKQRCNGLNIKELKKKSNLFINISYFIREMLQKYSYESALQLVITRWNEIIQQIKISLTIFLNFKLAFETISKME